MTTLLITNVSCMYCNHTWKYRGNNPTNICCPNCKNRFDITKGKALYFNQLIVRVNQLECELSEIKSDKSMHVLGEDDSQNQ
jgi:hypothetical protein